MANKYYTEVAGNSGTGTLEDPYKPKSYAITQATSGDTLILVDGEHTTLDANGFWEFAGNFDFASQTYRGATIKGDSGVQTTRVSRVDNSYLVASNPLNIGAMVIDAENTFQYGFEFTSITGSSTEVYLTGTEIKDGTTYCCFINNQRGTNVLTNVKISGSPSAAATTGLIYSTANLGATAAVLLGFNDLELVGSRTSNTLFGAFLAQQNNAAASEVTILFNGVKGTLTATGTASAVGANIRSESCVISGWQCDIDARDTTGTGNYGIWVIGNALKPATSPVITNFNFQFLAKAGYAVSLGTSTTDSYVTGGEMSGGYCNGYYDVASTPHGAVMGMGITAGNQRGVVMEDFYAPFLFSLCGSGTQKSEGCRALNPYGPACYVKGTTAIEVSNFSAYYGTKYDCTDSVDNGIGCWFITDQNGTNTEGAVPGTSGATLSDHLYVIQDPTKINSFGGYQTGQYFTASNFIYIVPEGTIDIANDDWFNHNAANPGDLPNNTLAEFNAQSAITNFQIFELPANVVAAIGRSMAYNTGSGSSGGLIGGLTANGLIR